MFKLQLPALDAIRNFATCQRSPCTAVLTPHCTRILAVLSRVISSQFQLLRGYSPYLMVFNSKPRAKRATLTPCARGFRKALLSFPHTTHSKMKNFTSTVFGVGKPPPLHGALCQGPTGTRTTTSITPVCCSFPRAPIRSRTKRTALVYHVVNSLLVGGRQVWEYKPWQDPWRDLQTPCFGLPR
ncbi:hypothetical protein LshimejAT787_1100400 [Lyophyllum shimeji]|uniref:Uncharacterized protein n=1 Tax=Lyophyllum shimeji TaxID=47721 RepID=A0A9P3US46_LYOSH|nr:hypothetical protein LshimejAT787_1100400 [Lyophyllum shimeji]